MADEAFADKGMKGLGGVYNISKAGVFQSPELVGVSGRDMEMLVQEVERECPSGAGDGC